MEDRITGFQGLRTFLRFPSPGRVSNRNEVPIGNPTYLERNLRVPGKIVKRSDGFALIRSKILRDLRAEKSKTGNTA
jgi:hypothetical protein